MNFKISEQGSNWLDCGYEYFYAEEDLGRKFNLAVQLYVALKTFFSVSFLFQGKSSFLNWHGSVKQLFAGIWILPKRSQHFWPVAGSQFCASVSSGIVSYRFVFQISVRGTLTFFSTYTLRSEVDFCVSQTIFLSNQAADTSHSVPGLFQNRLTTYFWFKDGLSKEDVV